MRPPNTLSTILTNDKKGRINLSRKLIVNFKNQLGYLLLILSTCAAITLAWWIISDSHEDYLHKVFLEHDKLLLKEKYLEASKVLKTAIERAGDGPLDPIWLPIVRAQKNGYDQLGYYRRILEGDPTREQTYIEIANLIDLAPTTFQDQVKSRYLGALAEIAGVQEEHLTKHGLTYEQR